MAIAFDILPLLVAPMAGSPATTLATSNTTPDSNSACSGEGMCVGRVRNVPPTHCRLKNGVFIGLKFTHLVSNKAQTHLGEDR